MGCGENAGGKLCLHVRYLSSDDDDDDDGKKAGHGRAVQGTNGRNTAC